MGLKSRLFLLTPVWMSAPSAPSSVKPAGSFLKISCTRISITPEQPPRETTVRPHVSENDASHSTKGHGHMKTWLVRVLTRWLLMPRQLLSWLHRQQEPRGGGSSNQAPPRCFLLQLRSVKSSNDPTSRNSFTGQADGIIRPGDGGEWFCNK